MMNATQISEKHSHLRRATSAPNRSSAQSGISVCSCRLGDVRTLGASGQRVAACAASRVVRQGTKSDNLLSPTPGRIGQLDSHRMRYRVRRGIAALAAGDEDATPVARCRANRLIDDP